MAQLRISSKSEQTNYSQQAAVKNDGKATGETLLASLLLVALVPTVCLVFRFLRLFFARKREDRWSLAVARLDNAHLPEQALAVGRRHKATRPGLRHSQTVPAQGGKLYDFSLAFNDRLASPRF